MLIALEMDRIGGLTMRPVSDRWRRKIVRHIQNADDEREYIGERAWRDIQDGWSRKIRMDPWEFLTRVGWDATSLIGA